MFYILLVSEYLTVAQFDDETVQAIMEEALKYEGWTYVYAVSYTHLEEIEIEDYELPFPLEGNTRLWEINALCRMIQEMQGTPLYLSLIHI